MILTGLEIKREWKALRIDIQPFTLDQLNPNSYDLRLGNAIKTYTSYVLDARLPNAMVEATIPEEGLVLQPGRIYLGRTKEVIGSDHYVPIIHGKSSIARLGLFIHVTGDLLDIGFHDQCLLQMSPVQPIRVYPDMRIGHVSFWRTLGTTDVSAGKSNENFLVLPTVSCGRADS